jgi:hypothetical protein
MKIDIEEVIRALEEDSNSGFCLACGNEQEGVEGDAEGYECIECGAKQVMGAENVLLSLA